LQDICNQDVLIYRFLPHGSRKIEDCKSLFPLWKQGKDLKQIKMVCHDQETLCSKDYWPKFNSKHNAQTLVYPVLNKVVQEIAVEYHDYMLLLHSEMQSADVEWFEQNGTVGVYWWSHAIIARDWFRYASIDTSLTNLKTPVRDFLIYNRAWTGIREYRIKFAELVIDSNLQEYCQMTFNPEDNGKHWLNHEFVNSTFCPVRKDLDQHFCSTTASAIASADYNNLDYIKTAIEVVLETVFDDTKWHLTEKTLRPIACGHPFILVSTPGILKYLKRYGFKTFDQYFDESYDNISDPLKRLEAIVKLMSKLANLSVAQKQQLYKDIAPICEYNKRRFFSQEFFDQVIAELKTNFDHGYSFIQLADSHKHYERFQRINCV